MDPSHRVSGVSLFGKLARVLTSQNEDNKSEESGVADIQHRAGETTEADPGDPEQNCVQEDVPAGHSRAGKRPPVPPVVFSAQQEVHQKHGRGSRCDNHQPVAEEQEAKHVVDLVRPQRGHDKVELHEYRSKGEDTGQQQRGNSTQRTRHRRDLARDLVGLGGTFNSLEAISNRHGDSEYATYTLLESQPASRNT